MSTSNREIIPRRIKVTDIKEKPLLYEIDCKVVETLWQFDKKIIIDGTAIVIERVYKNVSKHKHNTARILHLLKKI